ncbi:MAG: DUF2933 domain-containing protein [Actinobacteria bacterium]|nr:DUF2933 domain-containing protein [Actinomycetota bacterium]
MGNYLFLLLILACPLMMIFMMRGMHGRHGGDASHGPAQRRTGGHGPSDSSASLDELRRQREQLNRHIEEREAEEQTPVGGARR